MMDHILIDYENIQPQSLGILADRSFDRPFEIVVFVGANQAKLKTDLAIGMQKLGDRARYVQIEGTGRNALDFHIAFYLGQLSAENRDSLFYVISKDTGFDPLIKYLRKTKNISVQREKDLLNIPLLKLSKTKPAADKIEAVKKNIAARGSSRPKKLSTLKSTIQSLFKETLQESELSEIVDKLRTSGFVTIGKQDKVSYSLRS